VDNGCDTGQTKHLGNQNTNLTAASILRLHAGEDQIKILAFGILCDDASNLQRLFSRSIIVGNMGTAVATMAGPSSWFP